MHQNKQDIIIKNFNLSHNSLKLLIDTELKILVGKKYGIIGQNGCGKSSLLKHIFEKKIQISDSIKILYVEQEVEICDMTPLDIILSADTERLELIEKRRILELKLDDLEDDNLGYELTEELIETDRKLKSSTKHMTAIERADIILSGLQFTEQMKAQKISEFSGGWRMRISLAKALFVDPDMLLLDEPTNHLDIEACIWLGNYLNKFKGTLLLVSHDRDFLNEIVTDIINFRENKLEYYNGNYDKYEIILKTTIDTQNKNYQKQQKLIKELKKRNNMDAKNKILELEKKGLIKKPKDSNNVKFKFDDDIYVKGNMIEIHDVSFGYDRKLFENFNCSIDCDSKIAIVGPNGVGKSSLMKILCGELIPNNGVVNIGRKTKIAKITQHFTDHLDVNSTALDFISQKIIEYNTKYNIKIEDYKKTQLTAKIMLCKFNLKYELLNLPMSQLSGGQKCKVSLCEAAIQKPNIFLLDEPTNHLDIKSVQSLINALSQYPGGLVIITHDQRLINCLAKELWILENQKIEIRHLDNIEYSFDNYKEKVISKISNLFV